MLYNNSKQNTILLQQVYLNKCNLVNLMYEYIGPCIIAIVEK